MQKVTTQSIVDTLEDVIREVRAEKKLDIEKQAKLVSMLVGRQIQAGSLHLQYKKAIARLPAEADNLVPLLSSDSEGA